VNDFNQRFRRVNPILDARPRFGPIPADLILPWGIIGILFYLIFQVLLNLGYLWTILMIAWGCGTWWLLTGSKPYRFLSKFVRVPHWCRGYLHYQTIAQFQAEKLAQRRQKIQKQKKASHR
jgi:hypothetical protein